MFSIKASARGKVARTGEKKTFQASLGRELVGEGARGEMW